MKRSFRKTISLLIVFAYAFSLAGLAPAFAQEVTILCSATVIGPTTPYLFDPGDTIYVGNFTLDWTDSSSPAGIHSYEIAVSDNANFNPVTTVYTPGDQSQYEFKNYINGTYYFRVRAIDNSSVFSAWSNVVDLVVEIGVNKNYNYISFEAEDFYNPYFQKGTERLITDDFLIQRLPGISKDNVVWVDERNNSLSSSDIYLYDLTNSIEKVICDDIYEQANPAISGDIIVWEDYRSGNADIYMYNLALNEEKPVCTAEGAQIHPAVYGTKVVWEDYRNGNADIYMLDLTTGVEKVVCGDPDDQCLPAIFADRVVWEDYRNGDIDIYMFDFSKNQEVIITTDISDQESPKIWGDWIVWTDWRNFDTSDTDIYMYDLETKTETPVFIGPSYQYYPAIGGDKIVWISEGDFNNNIFGYNIFTKETILLRDEVSLDSKPAIDKDTVVFDNGDSDIHLLPLVPYKVFYYDSPENSWAGAYTISLAETDFSSYRDFDTAREGDYAVWVRMSSESDSADSLIINLNDSADIRIADETGNNSPALRWFNFENGNSQQKVIAHLPQGRNRVYLKDIEAGTKIDSIIITDDLNYVPPDAPPSVGNWEYVVQDGFGDKNNFTSRMKIFRGGIFVSTSSTSYRPAIYKTLDGANFSKVFELKTPYKDGYNMYRTLELDTFKGEKLYSVSDNRWGGLHITATSDGDNFITNFTGNRGWWTKEIAEFKDYLYAGFYNDWNIYFIMRRTPDPMVNSNWLDVSMPTFSRDFSITKKKIRGKIVEKITYQLYGNITAESSSVFKGQLYIGTYNYGYVGRSTQGAQIWRTSNGTTWEGVLLDGFGDIDNRSITAMAAFGGYLYVAVIKAFEPCKIYRTDGEYHNGDIVWEPVVSDGFGRRYNSYISALYPYMGRLYAITAGWLYSKDIPKEEYSGGRVYATVDGANWESISHNGILDLDNTTLENIEAYRGSLYVTTGNSVKGTQVIKGKVITP